MPPILLGDLQLQLDRLLIELLKDLSSADWSKPTLAGKWTVKDIVAHLLDGSMRGLSMLRDDHFGQQKPASERYSDLVQFLNQLNADWIKATQRLSPQLLLELTEQYALDYADFLARSSPYEAAPFPVAWAGEEASMNWFHVAREYTERWHHQQQIRLALGQDEDSPLLAHPFYLPYLDTSFRGLPHHYRNTAGKNQCVQFTVTGVDQQWFLSIAEDQVWQLSLQKDGRADCEVTIPGTLAWRIFSKGINRRQAEQKITITGAKDLGLPILSMVAVMA